MDKFEKIADEAEYMVFVLGNLETNDVQLVDSQAVPVPERVAQTYHTRGLSFLGCIGLVKGQPRVALAEELDLENITQITQAFLVHLRKTMKWTARPDMNVN